MTPAVRDVAWLARLRQDDESALAELIRAYADVLTATAYGVLGSKDLADDAVQAVFVRLWHRRAELRDEGDLVAYLKRAAYNQALSQLRGEARETRRGLRAVEHDALPHARPQDASEAVSSEQLAEVVQQAIDQLAGRSGEIFRLWWTGRYSYAEIATLMGISVKGVEQARARALAALREALKGYWP